MAIGKLTTLSNRPFSNSRQPLFQGESACEVFVMKVEPRHPTTPLIRPYLYYDYLFVPRTKALIFSCINNPLIRPPCYYDQRLFYSPVISQEDSKYIPPHITLYPRGYSKQRNKKVPLTLAALSTVYVIKKSGTKFVLYL